MSMLEEQREQGSPLLLNGQIKAEGYAPSSTKGTSQPNSEDPADGAGHRTLTHSGFARSPAMANGTRCGTKTSTAFPERVLHGLGSHSHAVCALRPEA